MFGHQWNRGIQGWKVSWGKGSSVIPLNAWVGWNGCTFSSSYSSARLIYVPTGSRCASDELMKKQKTCIFHNFKTSYSALMVLKCRLLCGRQPSQWSHLVLGGVEVGAEACWVSSVKLNFINKGHLGANAHIARSELIVIFNNIFLSYSALYSAVWWSVSDVFDYYCLCTNALCFTPWDGSNAGCSTSTAPTALHVSSWSSPRVRWKKQWLRQVCPETGFIPFIKQTWMWCPSTLPL